jgi:hypothetical protein
LVSFIEAGEDWSEKSLELKKGGVMKSRAWGIGAIGIFFLGILFLASSPAPAGEDKIVVKTENGIPVVYNPKNPVPPAGGPTALTLKLDLTIGQEAEDPNYMFSQLRSIQVDEQENIYALDMKELKVKVYDKNGKFVRSFGKKGQGPGEIDTPIRMEMTRDNCLVIDDMGNNKLIFYSLTGSLIKEIPTGKYWALIRFKFDSKGCIFADTRSYEETKMTAELKKFSPDFKPLSTLASFEEKRIPRVMTEFSPTFALQMRSDDKLIWSIAETEKYEFTITDSNGKVVGRIIKDHDPVKITAAIKERLTKESLGDRGLPPGYKYELPDQFPAFYYFGIDDQNRLFVCTYAHEEKDGDYWPYYDVFDAEGRYIAKFCHPRREMVFTAKKNKIYCMIQESEEGIPLIKRYSMIWK